jgi:hypothetical protein
MGNDDLKLYAETLWEPEDLIEIRPLPKDIGRRRWVLAKNIPALYSELLEENQRGANIYAGILPRTKPRGGMEKHVAGGRVLYTDLDGCTVEEAIHACEFLGVPPPTLVTCTGHGVHCFWKLDRFVEKAQWKELEQRIISWFLLQPQTKHMIDKGVKDPARILRLPGFTNHKPPVAESYLCQVPGHIYSPEDIEGFFEVPEPSPAPVYVPQVPAMHSGPVTPLFTRAQAYVATVQGCSSGGRTNTAFRCACAMVNDFQLNDSDALFLLTQWDQSSNLPPIGSDYGPDELAKILKNAHRYAKKAAGTLASVQMTPYVSGVDALSQVDLSGILAPPKKTVRPGIEFPKHLFNVPGILGGLIDHTMAKSAVPNRMAAFAGAISVLAMLLGRKVRFMAEAETRTNMNLIVLAASTTGKNAPRETNLELIAELMNRAKTSKDKTDIGNRIANKFASGQGIVKSLSEAPSMLFQIDEIDKLLTRLSGNRADSKSQEIEQIIMELYSSSKSLFHGDKRASSENNITIDQPCLGIFGTATPGVFYDSMTADALRNGFVGRLLPLESRGVKKFLTARERLETSSKRSSLTLSDEVINVAQYWVDFQTVPGNLPELSSSCSPMWVHIENNALSLLDDFGMMAHKEYLKALKQYGDEAPECAIWGRYAENRNKMALVYACSANPLNPFIGTDAVQWAGELVEYMDRILIRSIRDNVADSVCHKLALKLKSGIRELSKEAPDGLVLQRQLRRKFGVNKRDFSEAIELLIDSGEIEMFPGPNTTGTATFRYGIAKLSGKQDMGCPV